MSELKSIRRQQAYGAICLAAFCAHFGVLHPAVSALIAHRFSLLREEDLPSWESAGTQLEIPGLGEPLPRDIRNAFPPKVRGAAEQIFDCVTEIGAGELYGVVTGNSGRVLHEVIKLAESCDVSLPPIEPISFGDEDGWGAPLGTRGFENLKRAYADYLGAFDA